MATYMFTATFLVEAEPADIERIDQEIFDLLATEQGYDAVDVRYNEGITP